MPQPRKHLWRKAGPRRPRPTDLDQLLNLLRSVDRTVVEMSMKIYKVPRRDRAAMLEHHRRLHDMVREQFSAIPFARPKSV